MNEFEPKDMPIFLNELARNFPDDDETRMKLAECSITLYTLLRLTGFEVERNK